MEIANKHIMNEFTDCLQNEPNHAYDFICNNYYKFSKDELKNIVKELLYGIYKEVSKTEHDDILSNVAEELNELYEDSYSEV